MTVALLSEIKLPQREVHGLQAALFPLHRQIDGRYQDLPWPAEMRKIGVFTELKGGLGDVSAAAKAIRIMQEFCSDLDSIDWVTRGLDDNKIAEGFLSGCKNLSKVKIRHWQSESSEGGPLDFLLTGPVSLSWKSQYLKGRIIQREVHGPIFNFEESANFPGSELGEPEELRSFNPGTVQDTVKSAPKTMDVKELYQSVHLELFPSAVSGNGCFGHLAMGLLPGSGVLLDRGLLEAPLSRDYCCPRYLRQIKDAELQKDILQSMNVSDEQSEPDYAQYSFNFGYAHEIASKEKFIDCIAIHEKSKHVTIVLNYKNKDAPDVEGRIFKDSVFTPGRLKFLKEHGYGTVAFKTKGQKQTFLQTDEHSSARCLTVLVYPSFSADDMRQMQLAAERLLATGDNSAIEAWCARCRLYLYETWPHKKVFLQQQMNVAKEISPSLSRLLCLFGGDDKSSILSKEEMIEVEQLLNDPELSTATLQLCKKITTSYSFSEVLEGALKRSAWHHCIPDLARVEAESFDGDFCSGLIEYLKDSETSGDAPEKTLRVMTLRDLDKRVHEAVWQCINIKVAQV
jgi:hypothetical protein